MGSVGRGRRSGNVDDKGDGPYGGGEGGVEPSEVVKKCIQNKGKETKVHLSVF